MKRALFFLFIYALPVLVFSQQERTDILNFLEEFQDGYNLRDTSKVKEWTHRLMTDDVYIIGTNGVYPNTGEWQKGIKKAEVLFSNDWTRWGVLEADIENADIQIVSDDVAIVAMFATVTKSVENGYGRSNKANMERCIQRLASLSNDTTKSAEQKLYTAIWDAGMVLKQTELGETFVWPVRISMVLVKKENKWEMVQTHYSYPMAGYPPVRLIGNEIITY